MKKLLQKEKPTLEQVELEVILTRVQEVKEEEVKIKAEGAKVKDKAEEVDQTVDQGEAHQLHLDLGVAPEALEATKDQQTPEDHPLVVQEGLQLLLGEVHQLLDQEEILEVLEALEDQSADLLLQEVQEDLQQAFQEEAHLVAPGVDHLEDQEVGPLVIPEADLPVEIEVHQAKAIVEVALQVVILHLLDLALTDHLEEALREIIMMDHLEAQTDLMIMMLVLLLLILAMVPQEVGEKDFLEQEVFHHLVSILETPVNLITLKLNQNKIQQKKKNKHNPATHVKLKYA